MESSFHTWIKFFQSAPQRIGDAFIMEKVRSQAALS
jgi:hypothetical protein